MNDDYCAYCHKPAQRRFWIGGVQRVYCNLSCMYQHVLWRSPLDLLENITKLAQEAQNGQAQHNLHSNLEKSHTDETP